MRAVRHIAWAPPLLARVALGVTFIGAGWGKLHNLEAVTGYFTSLGIPLAELQAPMVAGIELVAGVLLVLGLATRIAAALLAAVMAVALATAIWPNVGTVRDVLGSIEAIYLATLAYLVVHGAGAASCDHVAARRIPALRVFSNQATQR